MALDENEFDIPALGRPILSVHVKCEPSMAKNTVFQHHKAMGPKSKSSSSHYLDRQSFTY